jgi:hypothetical protein
LLLLVLFVSFFLSLCLPLSFCVCMNGP